MKIPFIKAHSTGNDFIIFIRDECPSLISNATFIKKICNRRQGIGADGVLILSKTNDYDFKMDYFNADGSWETMCANGARCAGLLMATQGQCPYNMTMITGDGEHTIEIIDKHMVRLSMKSHIFKTDEILVNDCSGRHVDSGARHFVTEIKGLSQNQVQLLGPKIRSNNFFMPYGINVNCVELLDENTIKVITYEKGVEQVMLSCGSGSTASAYYMSKKHGLSSPILIKVPGGELSVEFNEDWSDVWLSGPATIIFSSTINSELFIT